MLRSPEGSSPYNPTIFRSPSGLLPPHTLLYVSPPLRSGRHRGPSGPPYPYYLVSQLRLTFNCSIIYLREHQLYIFGNHVDDISSSNNKHRYISQPHSISHPRWIATSTVRKHDSRLEPGHPVRKSSGDTGVNHTPHFTNQEPAAQRSSKSSACCRTKVNILTMDPVKASTWIPSQNITASSTSAINTTNVVQRAVPNEQRRRQQETHLYSKRHHQPSPLTRDMDSK